MEEDGSALCLLHCHGIVWHRQYGAGQRHVGDDIRDIRSAAVGYGTRSMRTACGSGIRRSEVDCQGVRTSRSVYGAFLCRGMYRDTHHERSISVACCQTDMCVGVFARGCRRRFCGFVGDDGSEIWHCPWTVLQRVGTRFGAHCGCRRTNAQSGAPGAGVVVGNILGHRRDMCHDGLGDCVEYHCLSRHRL